MQPDYVEVQPGVFLGSREAVLFVPAMGATHVLSIIDYIVDMAAPVEHLRIPLMDEESTNILEHLDTCCNFIDSAVKGGGKVLVHCQAGISRSATAVLAYLMRSHELDVDQALAMLMEKRRVYPNNGFRMQLEVYRQMGYRVDVDSKVYRRTARMLHAAHMWCEGTMDEQALATLADCTDLSKVTAYRCRKCLELLACSDNVVFQKEFPNVGLLLYVEPLRWMAKSVAEPLKGMLNCPKCQACVGSFDWFGSSSNVNSSNHHVWPVFELPASNLHIDNPAD